MLQKKQLLKPLHWLFLLWLSVCAAPQNLHAQATTVTGESQDISKNVTPSKQYIYFKIKESNQLVIRDFKKGSELPAELASLAGIAGIEKIHRPFAILKTPVLERTYRIQCENASNVQTIIARLKALPFVEFAVPDQPIKTHIVPNDFRYDKQWGLKKINAEEAWNITTGSSNVTVAVVDVAFRLDHEDLAPVMWTNPGEIPGNGIDDDSNGYIDDVNGWDVADNDNNPAIPSSIPFYTFAKHGTLCASTAVAASNNYKGIASPAYGCKLIPVKTLEDIYLTSNGGGNMWDGIAYAIAANADIVSISLGGYYDPSDPMVGIYQNMIDAGHSAGIVFIASAGNEGVQFLPAPNAIKKIYPASLNHVISVGSTDPDDKKSLFSNWGYVSDADIYAPGEYIHCASAEATDAYEFATGTSISAPMVAGVCALIKSANPSYNAAQIESCLLNGAFNTDALNPAYAGLMGAGRVDAKFAVTCAANITTDFFIQNAQQVCNNTNAIFEAVLSDPNYRYFWDFGDGGSANNVMGNTVSHTYTTNGLYTVSLTIKNTLGAVLFTATKNEYVMVTACTPVTGENAHWYFGNKAGLDFTSGKPQAGFDNTLNFIGGSTCITDASTNNIAFYGGPVVNTFSYEINDNLHNYVYTSQSGHMYNPANYAEGGLLLKKPGIANDYNLFVAPQNGASGEGFYLYDIDPYIPSGFELQAGTPMPAPLGAVLDANNAPFTSNQLTAVKACAADEYWIITVSNNQNSNPESFYIYKFAASPAVSLVNTVSISSDYYLMSPLKASPDGSMIAVSYSDVNDYKNYTKIYTFNRSTGDLQDLVTLEGGSTALAFSPDSKLLYLTGYDQSIFTSYTLYQYDLTSGSPSESKKLVCSSTTGEIVALQMGPDNVIYVNFGSKQYVGAIYFPDEKITSSSHNACGFTTHAVSLVSSPLQNIHSGKGFPNDVDATNFPIDFTFTPKNCNQVDFKTSICASTYTWYFNDGTSSNLQNPTHTFASPGTYIVHLNADGQHIFKNVDIYAQFTASLTMNVSICDRSNGIELNASPTGSQYAYKWYKNGILIDGFSADKYWTTSPGIYHVEVTDTRGGCTSSSNTYDYDPNRGFEITMVTPNSYTGFNGVDIGVDVNLYPNSYTTYTWFRDGEYYSGPCNCPTINTTLPGTYVVVGNGACGETTSNEFRLKIDPFCSSLAGVGPPAAPGNYQTVTGSWAVSVPPGPLYGTIISGTVTIPSGTTISLSHSNLIMDRCSKIIVEPGGALYLTKVNITGCGSWEGIIVQGASVNNNGYGSPNTSNGILVMDQCYLSDAAIGVYAMNNGYIKITESEFDNNTHHIAVNQTPYAPHFSTISGNKFRRIKQAACMHTYYASPYAMFKPAVVLENVIMAEISDNDFISDYFEPAAPLTSAAFFPYFNNRSLLLSNTHNISVTRNHFNKANTVALYAGNSIQLNVADNYFNGGAPLYTRQMTGMYIENTHLFAFNNEFRHCYSGFEYYGVNHASMLMHNNFEDNMFANIVAPQANPLTNANPFFNNSAASINLTIDCNKYLSNNLSITGSGNLVQQGNPTTDASNSFTNSLESNILWQWPFNPSPTVDYYFGSYTDPNALVGPGYPLNGTFQFSTDITTIGLIPPFYSCYGSWKKDITSTDPVYQSQVNAYPNPFTTRLEIDLSNIQAQNAFVKICDIQGKVLFEDVVETKTNKITINTPDWAAGIYILTISTDTEIAQTKLVKTNY